MTDRDKKLIRNFTVEVQSKLHFALNGLQLPKPTWG